MTEMLSIKFFLRISEVLSVDLLRRLERGLERSPKHLGQMHSCTTCSTRVHSEPEESNGTITIVLGAFDNSLECEPKGEIFTNYKMKWLRDSGCIRESFEEAAVMKHEQAMMENLDQLTQDRTFNFCL